MRRKRIAGRACAVACTLAALGALGGTAYAGSVRIVSPSGGSQTLDLSSLPGKPDVPEATYSAIDLTPGGTPEPVTVSDGYSLMALLTDAGILGPHPIPFGSAEIVAPSGPPIVLSFTQATSPSAFTDGPPVVWDSGSGADFLVPSTPTGSSNAGETFAGPGGTITVQLFSGQPLAIGIYATPQPAIVNRPVRLHASIYGGAVQSFQWTLGDGAISSEAAPFHTYTRIGTYNVYLQAQAADSPGASTIYQLVVGNPPPAPVAGSAGVGIGGTGTGGTGTGTGGNGSGSGSAGQAKSIPAAPPRRPRVPTHRARKPPPPTGPLVSGILIADTPQAIAAAESAAAGAARSARTARREASLAQWVYIVIAVLLMLFIGALLEWNNPRAWFAAPSPT